MDKLTYKELLEWIGYYEIEPWGSQIEGMRTAANTSAVYNAGLMNAAPKEYNRNPAKPTQFFIGVTLPRKKPVHWKELRDKFRAAIPKSMYKKA